jgi:hypothetical protein
LAEVRKAIEEKFGLIQETGQKLHVRAPSTPKQKIRYGEKPTTQAIAEAVQYIRQHYRFRNLAELNAILQQYNVIARPGRPGSRIHQHGGLLYQVLDDAGKGVGAPVKSSILAFTPTLRSLARDFQKHSRAEAVGVGRIKWTFDAALGEAARGSARFGDALRRGGLAVAADRDEWGKTVGLLIVDFQSKRVVRADELGYELDGLRKKLSFDPLSRDLATEKQGQATEMKRSRGRRL